MKSIKVSKSSEIASLKAFPPKFTSPKRYAKRVQSEKVDTHATIRRFYQEGYEQAEKDTIERACDILMNYVFEEVTPEMRDHFRKRLEEE